MMGLIFAKQFYSFSEFKHNQSLVLIFLMAPKRLNTGFLLILAPAVLVFDPGRAVTNN